MLFNRNELVQQYTFEILVKQNPKTTLEKLLKQNNEILQEVDKWIENKDKYIPYLTNLKFVCPVAKVCNGYVGILKEIEFIYTFNQSV